MSCCLGTESNIIKKHEPLSKPFSGPYLMNMFWNFALSRLVSGGKAGGGGDFGNDIPVVCCAIVFIPSMTANGPAE